jgi:hypothetical protein
VFLNDLMIQLLISAVPTGRMGLRVAPATPWLATFQLSLRDEAPCGNPTIQQSNDPTIQQSNNPTIQRSNNPTI